MKSYRVKYTLEKVVVVTANNPQEAEDKASLLEDYNYDFYRDSLEAEEMQEKTISRAIYFKGGGLSSYNKKIVMDVPLEDPEFKDVESISFKQIEPQFIEIEIKSFNLKDLEIITLISNICENKLRTL